MFTLAALDINCHQHIHKRYSLRQINPVIEKLEGRIAELEAEVARLQGTSSPSDFGRKRNVALSPVS